MLSLDTISSRWCGCCHPPGASVRYVHPDAPPESIRPSDEVSASVATFRRSATAGFRQAAAFLAERVDRKIHPVPQAACEFGLLAATDVAQSRIVFGDRSGLRINYSPKSLKARITALLLAYLRHG